MSLYACPNCGITEQVAIDAPDPGPCPRCCARLRPATSISWQRWPQLPFPADRPRVRLALSPSATAPSFARRAVAGLRDELDEAELFTCELLVSELVTNVVLHAADSSPPRATTTVWLATDRVRVDVQDRGSGFRPRVQRDAERESGWGLQLVDELADSWGVVPGSGSWVWFELNRRRPAERVAPRVRTVALPKRRAELQLH
jgi:anti-sigma regulatory factor (Ser/Thr protein kinase)